MGRVAGDRACVFRSRWWDPAGEAPLPACMHHGGWPASAVHGRSPASVLHGRSPASPLPSTGPVWWPPFRHG